MSCKDFFYKCKLKNEATSNIKTSQVLPSLSLSDVRFYLGDDPIQSVVRVVKVHPNKGSHWVCYIKENYFDSYGGVCPEKL